MIESQSSTRVDMAGGTLDMWPLYCLTGRACKTINVAIDVFTRARLRPKNDGVIEITSVDYKSNWEFKNVQEFLMSPDPRLHLYRCVVHFFYDVQPLVLGQGFFLETDSESPIGGGLGGSSSLMISMMKAFSELTRFKFESVHHMVQCAHNIEAQILMTPTGTQDYYPAVTGGVSILEYSTSRISQKILDLTTSPLSSHFLLINTGKSHHSGLNNFEVLKAAVSRDEKVLRALKQINSIAHDMCDVLLNQRWEKVPALFQAEYEARIQLTPAFTSPEIELLSKLVIANGATGVKICGAGGGGCVLVWVDPVRRQKVIEACEKAKFQCLNSRVVRPLDLPRQNYLKSFDL